MEKDDCCCCNIKEENKGKWRITQLIAGAVFFAVGIIVDNFFSSFTVGISSSCSIYCGVSDTWRQYCPSRG